ncbi:MAG: sigma-54-dependent Fis family transcriptional regulator [bacterium]|jgi:two-component system response regulator HydG|nr:sigma-54-dependent Fis family transcriptional regulator [candidate division KSB1 bacterium]MDH7561072.1 sigma-54-dependent Fis family transcriptional regulator [bacterium]
MTTPDEYSALLSRLAEVGEALLPCQDLDALLDALIDGAVRLVGCCQASLMLFDAQMLRLTHERVRGFPASRSLEARLVLTEDVAKWMYEGGELLALAEEQGARFLMMFAPGEARHFRCELRLPFYVKGLLVGVLSLGQKGDGTDYGARELDALRVLMSQGVMCLERLLPQEQRMTGGQGKQARQRLIGFQVRGQEGEPELLGQSPAMQAVRQLIDEVAPRDVPVLIAGESGTGKELVARAIHRKSQRATCPMVTVNCAALPDALVESELFGHEKGAFTGACSRKMGKFEFAHGSTLFLDEIGDMSLAVQAKLLRVIELGTFQRVGGNDTLQVDVRLITATNRDLRQEINLGRFREDLYYRINVVEIALPPLRQRREDIPLLADFFVRRFARRYQKPLKGIDPRAQQRLVAYDYPGNVRELQNIIERAVILERGPYLTFHLVPFSPLEGKALVADSEHLTLEQLERRYIEQVMRAVGHNKSQAARILGIARKTLREKLVKYRIAPP